MTVANFSARNFDPETKYIPFKNTSTSKASNKLDIPVFQYQNLLKEANQLPKRTKIKYVKICLAALTAFTSISILGIPTFAETIPQVIEVVNQTGLQTEVTNPIMPKDILEIGKWIIGICAVVGFVLAIILLQLAGGLRMLRKRKEATEWTSDILKGFMQLMLAPVLIVTIALVCYLLFGGTSWFVKPF